MSIKRTTIINILLISDDNDGDNEYKNNGIYKMSSSNIMSYKGGN